MSFFSKPRIGEVVGCTGHTATTKIPCSVEALTAIQKSQLDKKGKPRDFTAQSLDEIDNRPSGYRRSLTSRPR